jgi:hypothetical protein
MGVVMNISSYEVECYEAEYGDEVLCAGWNPAVMLACQQLSISQPGRMQMPSDLATIDAEMFLQKMYAYQR